MSSSFLIFFIVIIFILLGWIIYLTFVVRSYISDKKQVLSEAKEKGLGQEVSL